MNMLMSNMEAQRRLLAQIEYDDNLSRRRLATIAPADRHAEIWVRNQRRDQQIQQMRHLFGDESTQWQSTQSMN